MIIVVEGGIVKYLYNENFEPIEGKTTITRASHVEPEENGKWSVDLSPINGEVVKGFDKRSDALKYEEGRVNQWLQK
jgi:hypothetical protein